MTPARRRKVLERLSAVAYRAEKAELSLELGLDDAIREGLTYTELAAHLGVTVQAVHQRIGRIRRRRALLAPYLAELAEPAPLLE